MHYLFYFSSFFIVIGVKMKYSDADSLIVAGILGIIYISTISFFNYLSKNPNE